MSALYSEFSAPIFKHLMIVCNLRQIIIPVFGVLCTLFSFLLHEYLSDSVRRIIFEYCQSSVLMPLHTNICVLMHTYANVRTKDNI